MTTTAPLTTGVAAGEPHAVATAIAFGAFHLDRAGGRLLRGATAIPLRPKTWAVLHYRPSGRACWWRRKSCSTGSGRMWR